MKLQFKQYKIKGLSEMIKWQDVPKGDRALCSISESGQQLAIDNPGEFELGYMARNPKNHEDTWYVSKKYFDDNLEEIDEVSNNKTLNNTNAIQAKNNVKDIVFWGDGDTFKLISKASSKNEGWMKSTKAMEIYGVGCVIQVTTQQGDNIAEALTFVPGVRIQEYFEDNSKILITRKIVKI